MADRANVASIEAIESFRNSLIVYLEKAGRTLDEVNDEVLRTRVWLESDRRVYWEREIRRRARALEEAQQRVFSSRISNLREVTHAEQAAVVKASRALGHAQDKLSVVKDWNRQFDSRVAPLGKQVDKLRDVLVHMGKAVAYLTRTTATLRAYAGVSPAGNPAASGSAAEEAPAADLNTPTPDNP